MRRWLMAVIVPLVMVSTGCSSTFVMTKDGRGYHWGNDSKAVYIMLCESGDLKKILADTRLKDKMKEDIFKYNCTAERSGERVRQIYATMTPEERKDLRNAFTRNGYDINYIPCCDVINTTSGRI